MKKQTFNLMLLCSILLIFTQCKKECVIDPDKSSKSLGTIKLSNAELDIVPYSVNDSLIFKDSLGNTKLFIVELIQKPLYRMYKNGGTDSSTDYYEIEQLSVKLSNNTNSISIILKAPLPYYCSNQNINYNFLRILLGLPDFNSSLPGYSYSCYLDPTDFYYNLNGTAIPFHNSLTLFINTYNSVYEIITNYSNQTVLYYNKTEGIVGFRLDNGAIWYLDK